MILKPLIPKTAAIPDARPARRPPPARISLLEPLRGPVFRSLWIASMASNIGTQMHNAGAGWQMTLLTSSPLLLGLVSVMANAPVLFLSPLAGAVTDVSDRRHLLLTTQSLLAVAAGLLALSAFGGWLNPKGLLVLIGMMGIASVFNQNCWSTVVQDSVPRHHLPPAVSLNSISVNSARSLGPALAGLLIAWIGTGMVFLLNALSFLGVIFVINRWREPQEPARRKASSIGRAMKEGFLYLRSQRLLALLLIRHLLFITAGVSVVALLPLLAKTRLGLDAKGFGLLSSCFGMGAIVASMTAHSLAARFGIRHSTRAGMALSMSMLLAIAHVSNPVVAGGLMLLKGFSWTFISLNHNVRVRMTAAPAFVGRVYSYYSMCATGGMALGGFLFGWLASLWGLTGAITAAAFLSLIALLLALRHPMPQIYREIETAPEAPLP
ncbi:MAG TPA: MFS transporter [Chthoniobacteraceae bacterium]|nr:MFS transporter [Chthoniobacteraceae bacterium]